MDLLADLDARGLIQESTDRDALAARLAAGPDHPLLRLRPDGRQPPPRQPDRPDHAAPVPGRRPRADRPRRRGDGDGRRPERALRGAQPARRRHARPQRRRDQGADRPHRRPRGRVRPARRQPRLDAADDAARVPARRRQARHGQPDDGPRERAGPAGVRARHLLHRVQLHAAAGERLPVAARPPRVRAADRRLRPVGQHRLRRRPDPAHAAGRRSTPWPGRCSPAPTAPSWARRPAPGCGSTRPRRRRTSSTSTGCSSTTPSSSSSSRSSRCGRWRRSRSSWPRTPPRPSVVRASGRWPTR